MFIQNGNDNDDGIDGKKIDRDAIHHFSIYIYTKRLIQVSFSFQNYIYKDDIFFILNRIVLF
jgi:hypothetical protein